MPFTKLETTRTIAGKQVSATLDIPVLRDPRFPQTLGFEVWFFAHGNGPILRVLNPSLDIVLYRRVAPSGRHTEEAVRLPIATGDLGDTGGVLDSQAMIWRPFA